VRLRFIAQHLNRVQAQYSAIIISHYSAKMQVLCILELAVIRGDLDSGRL